LLFTNVNIISVPSALVAPNDCEVNIILSPELKIPVACVTVTEEKLAVLSNIIEAVTFVLDDETIYDPVELPVILKEFTEVKLSNEPVPSTAGIC